MKKPLTKEKLKSRLVRKGIFTQFPLEDRELERENRLFRTVIDYAIFDILSNDIEARNDAIKFFNPESSCAENFNTICMLSGLHPEKTRGLVVHFVDNFFPEIFEETSCPFRV